MAPSIEAKANEGCGASNLQDESSSAPEDAAWVDVMDADDLWIGDMIAVESVMGPLLLVNVDGAVCVYENRCPHNGGRLSDGEFANGVIVCPNHRWEFCASSGRGVNPTGVQLKQHLVRIVGGRILIAARRT
jgi:nitrite reductase/ring-hydroxylating ferredoxin subunit